MKIGRYELLTELGAGGMATLHLARRLGPDQFQKLVVIKRIHEKLSADPEAAGRFLDEARLAARIVHPNVVQIFDFDRQGGSEYIAMEYVHGIDLMALFERAGQGPGLHWSLAARVVADAAAGLHAAHELRGDQGEPLRLVHRDVSLQNILVSFDGHVKVTDFGIAHAVGRASRTLLGEVIGKVAYMSPEQCRGAPLDRRSDVFALGVVLHELVTLRRLFRAATDQETMQRVLSGQVPPLCALAPTVPVALQHIASRALSADPVVRFQTAAELQNALEQLLVREGLLVNAGSLQALMETLFSAQRVQRDALVAELYRRALPEQAPGGQVGRGDQAVVSAPAATPAATSAAAAAQAPAPALAPARSPAWQDAEPTAPPIGEETDPWGDASAATVQDVAPPAVLQASGARRTRMGFEVPDEEPGLGTASPSGASADAEASAPGAGGAASGPGGGGAYSGAGSPRLGAGFDKGESHPRYGTAMGRPAMPDARGQGQAPARAPAGPGSMAGSEPVSGSGPMVAAGAAYPPLPYPSGSEPVSGSGPLSGSEPVSGSGPVSGAWPVAGAGSYGAAHVAATSSASSPIAAPVGQSQPSGLAAHPSAGGASSAWSTERFKAGLRPRRWPWVLGLMLLILALSALLWKRGCPSDAKRAGKQYSKAQEASPGAPEPRPPGARTDVMVTLRVSVTPLGARLWVGGEEWTSQRQAPVREVRVPRQSAPLLLRVEADGHVAAEVSPLPDADREIEIRLKPLPRPRSRFSPTRSSAPGTGLGPRSEPLQERPRPRVRPTRPDLKDPF